MDDADKEEARADHRPVSCAAVALALAWLSLALPGAPASAPVVTLGIGLVLSAAFERWHQHWFNARAISLVAFAMVWIVAMLAADAPALSASRSAAWLAGAIVLLLCQVRFRSADFLLIGTGLYAAGLLSAAAVLLHSRGADPAQTVIDQLDSILLVVPNDIAIAALLVPLIMLTPLSQRARWWALGLGQLMVLLAAIALHSRLGILTILITTASAIMQRRPGLAVGWLGVIGIGIGLALALREQWAAWIGSGDSIAVRWTLWQSAWGMFVDQPWFGIGPQLFGEQLAAYLVAPLADTRAMPWPHNLWLETLLGLGIVGGVVFVGVLLLHVKALISLNRRFAVPLIVSGTGWICLATFEASWLRFGVVMHFTTWCALLGAAYSVTRGADDEIEFW
ncbi:O-antigen ligase family protein [Wenzhouxiangella sp. EGI_FJ10409]|uniref:O-antigen ligase family protein n=1 Tax=Wenzhouxiangella sp. EGI_FJ10409 TaxID=3243767 RepID=UPI0035DE58FD